MRVGVISDTHNLLRPRVLERLEGCDRLLHAGDVGDLEILERLRRIAPVEAIRGNTDSGATAAALPETLMGDLDDISGRAGIAFRLIHRREDVDPKWPAQLRLLIYGHSHRPEMAWQGNCLLLNPGACGPRRFHLPLTLAILTVAADRSGRFVPEILSVE